jgi:hypothetical protein
VVGHFKASLLDSDALPFSIKDETFFMVDKCASGSEMVDMMIDQALGIFMLYSV